MFNELATGWFRWLGGPPCFRIYGKARQERRWRVIDVHASQRRDYSGRSTTKSKYDTRTEFERDYDRAIFSTPVRRLQDKAQVFPLEPVDAVRTRLTHSLELSTVSRDLAGQAARWIRERGEIDENQAAELVAIAATCGLIHDLGNPPFGHAGETAIEDWFECQDDAFFADFAQKDATGRESPLAIDFLRFEGDAQDDKDRITLTGLGTSIWPEPDLRHYVRSLQVRRRLGRGWKGWFS